MCSMIKYNLNLVSNFRTLLFSVLYCLFMFSSISMEAQNKVPVGGKLKYEKTKEPIVGATIFAIAMDSSVAAGSVSKEDGTFSILLERG